MRWVALLSLCCFCYCMQSSSHKPWFSFLSKSLEVCMRQSYNPTLLLHSGFSATRNRKLKLCVEAIHSDQMRCNSLKQKPQHFLFRREIWKTGYSTWFDDRCNGIALTSPCGQITLKADVTFLQCRWIIHVAALLSINATFTRFKIPRVSADCRHDRLQFDSMEQQHQYSSRFCGVRQPFVVIPNISKLQLQFYVAGSHYATGDLSEFALRYQVVGRNVYVLPGRADFENVQTDTSQAYNFSATALLLKTPTYSRYSLHFNVQIGYNVKLQVDARSMTLSMRLHVHDGPSTQCHLLKEITRVEIPQTASSFGPSMLLLLHTDQLNGTDLEVTFSSELLRLTQLQAIINVSDSMHQLHLPLHRESRFCMKQNSITFCDVWLASNQEDRFVQLKNIDIHVDVPYIHNCYFASLWIFDGGSEEYVWRWCGFKTRQLPRLNSATDRLRIQVIMYDIHGLKERGQSSYVTMALSLSPCPGVFPLNDLLFQQLARRFIEVTNIYSSLYVSQIPGKCVVIQMMRAQATSFTIHVFGERQDPNNGRASIALTVYRVSGNPMHNHVCRRNVEMFVHGMFSVSNVGDGQLKFFPMKENQNLSSVSFNALNWEANYDGRTPCVLDDGIVVAVQDACNNLFTEENIFSDVIHQPFEVSRWQVLMSACHQFSISPQPYLPVKLMLYEGLLCKAIDPNQAFPCISQQGTYCQQVDSCFMRITAHVSTSCRSQGFYVDVMNYDRTMRLRWDVKANKSMQFNINLLHEEDHDMVVYVYITKFNDLEDEECDVYFNQIIERTLWFPFEFTLLSNPTRSSCLVARIYWDDSARRRRIRCFKRDMAPEYIEAEGNMYIRIKSSSLSWRQAEQFCQDNNGHLLSITSQHDEQIVRTLFHGGRTLSPVVLYIGLTLNQQKLRWTDKRPMSHMRWNNIFIHGVSPIEFTSLYEYARSLGIDTGLLQHEYVSHSLVDTVTHQLQPVVPREPESDGTCTYMLMSSVYSPADWLMGPCDQRTDPGAFLCRLAANLTSNNHTGSHNQHASHCAAGSKLIEETCFRLTEKINGKDKDCDPSRDMRDEITRKDRPLLDWISNSLNHGRSVCKEIGYWPEPDRWEVISIINSSSVVSGDECSLCMKDATSGCPPGLFSCDDSSCVSAGVICDGKWDCAHGNDEATCEHNMCHIMGVYQKPDFCHNECSLEKDNCLCGLGFWQCRSGGCIAISKYCDYQEDCEDDSDEQCPQAGEPCESPLLQCNNGQCVADHDIFDWRRNCIDNSDESDHKYSYENLKSFSCSGSGIANHNLSSIRVNDLIPDCIDGTDEPIYNQLVHDKSQVIHYNCSLGYLPCLQHHSRCFPQEKSCLYELDLQQQMLYCRNGFHVMKCEEFPCSSDTLKCSSSYCLPLHYLCDGMWHCPDGDDEQNCNVNITSLCNKQDVMALAQSVPRYLMSTLLNGTCIPAIVPEFNWSSSLSNLLPCPGLFRCQFGQCLHPSLLCDGIVQCPMFADDETSCIEHQCPPQCVCLGKTVRCHGTKYTHFPPLPSGIRALEAQHNKAIADIETLVDTNSLLTIDISFNSITTITHKVLSSLPNIIFLDLSNNRLVALPAFRLNSQLRLLNVSGNVLTALPSGIFDYTLLLRFLDISGNKVVQLLVGTFLKLESMSVLALQKNNIQSIDAGLLRYFKRIDVLRSDKSQHCCMAQTVGKCSSSNDGFSTCEALLAKPIIKGFVYIMGGVGIAANSFVIATRLKEKKAHALLIANLAIADAAYSMYLIAIAVADGYYSGAYILYDDWWRNSLLCKILSVLSVFSSELSITTLLCIGIDRYVTIFKGARSPLSGNKLPSMMLATLWCGVFIISLLPALLTWLLGEDGVASNSICIMLDMTPNSSYRPLYLISVYGLLNCCCFVIILVLYVLIVRLHVQSSRKVGRKVNLTLFKRTVMIVLMNFLSWAPVTAYILLTYFGVSSSSDVTVWMAVVILPLSSAANPVVYTLSAYSNKCTSRKKKVVQKQAHHPLTPMHVHELNKN